VALTLREVCGLTTEEIARAFLTAPSTLAQRIVRAKAKIREARIPYPGAVGRRTAGPAAHRAQVIYLVFNEGYAASSGESLTRADLSGEAIRLGRLLAELLPEPEAIGLLALMLLQESRRAARSSPSGELIFAGGSRPVSVEPGTDCGGFSVVRTNVVQPGPYAIQAAIAAVHAQTADGRATDWPRIVELYTALLVAQPSPVVELNRAVCRGNARRARSGIGTD
jgi:RNA polymerase sigma-70 factor (ECF subfamily)